MPLGHPAHVLNAGKTTIGAGVAGTIVPDPPVASGTSPQGRLHVLTVAPDVSPWVSGRAGLGGGFEAGLTASTRSIRADGRRAIDEGPVTLSVGLGASAMLLARADNVSSGVYGFGLDLPLLLGWRSSADLYSVWVGPRVGGELFEGNITTDTSGTAGVKGQHLHVGGLAGLRAGLRHVYAVVEFEFAYHLAGGSVEATSVEVSGWTVAPFGGLVVSF